MAKERFLLKGDTELELIANDQAALDTLIWTTVCVIAALDARDEDAKSVRYPAYRDQNLLSHEVFRLLKDSKQLEWRHVKPILHRFWFPLHLEDRWKEGWTRGLRSWRSHSRQ